MTGLDKELKQLIKFLRANGVVSYKHQGLELLLDPNFKAPVVTQSTEPKHVPGELAAELKRAAPGFFGMTDEQVLMHSSES